MLRIDQIIIIFVLRFQDEEVKSVRNEDSFASKLSLNLLLKGFPNIDPVFVTNTFKSQNFSYYVSEDRTRFLFIKFIY